MESYSKTNKTIHLHYFLYGKQKTIFIEISLFWFPLTLSNFTSNLHSFSNKFPNKGNTHGLQHLIYFFSYINPLPHTPRHPPLHFRP